MKFIGLLVLLLGAGIIYVISMRRRIAREEAEAALARARVARRPKVPDVSSNVKGVTASQTIQPFKPKRNDPKDDLSP